MPARIIFMGSPAFAVPSLDALRERAHVVAVLCQPDRPAGRGQKLTPCPVKVAALAHGLTVLQPTRLKDPQLAATLAALQPDLAVVAAYGRILPPSLLTLPRLGCVNVHASLLPRHRGASPIAHAILGGDVETGVTLMQMDAGLDTGPMLATQSLPIGNDATCGTLTTALAAISAKLLARALPDLLGSRLRPIPQDNAQATHAPLLNKDDGRLDFARPAAELARRVRAFQPWPGCFTSYQSHRLQVLAASCAPHPPTAPCTIVDVGEAGVAIACGDGKLILHHVKPEGRKEMTATQWARGQRIRVGNRLDPVGAASYSYESS